MKPTTKTELMTASQQSYDQLLALISSLTPQQQEANFTFDVSRMKEAHWQRDRNLRDVLIHLWEWQKMLLKWINVNQAGEECDFLPAGYNWHTYGDLNQLFWQRNQEVSLQQAQDLLAYTHQEVMQLLTSFTNDELFQKKVYPWTGNNALGTYFIANTSSHYEWALKKIRKFKRSLK